MRDLDHRARDILRGNDRGGYTVPTEGLYPYQWNWDSAFAAWGFSTFSTSRAWTELETLLSGQWENGMVPHILFHADDPGYFPGPDVWATGTTPPSSGITQPPVAATMMARVWMRKLGDEDWARGRALYPKLLAWHRWFMEHRVREGVACVTHPWESGRDNCPDWDIGMANVDGSKVGPYRRRDTGHVDPSMRPTKEEYDRYVAILEYGRSVGWDPVRIVDEGPFLMADPGTHFILMRAHRDLVEMGKGLKEDVSEIREWISTLKRGAETLWNPEIAAYDAKDMRTGRFAGVLGSSAFLAYLAGVGRPELGRTLRRVWDSVAFGIPSSDPQAPHFDARRYWRGPMWPFLNALIALGFREANMHDAEARLRHETRAAIAAGGFNEYFDPTDGTPCGGANFTWTAAVWLTWAGRARGFH